MLRIDSPYIPNDIHGQNIPQAANSFFSSMANFSHFFESSKDFQKSNIQIQFDNPFFLTWITTFSDFFEDLCSSIKSVDQGKSTFDKYLLELDESRKKAKLRQLFTNDCEANSELLSSMLVFLRAFHLNPDFKHALMQELAVNVSATNFLVLVEQWANPERIQSIIVGFLNTSSNESTDHEMISKIIQKITELPGLRWRHKKKVQLKDEKTLTFTTLMLKSTAIYHIGSYSSKHTLAEAKSVLSEKAHAMFEHIFCAGKISSRLITRFRACLELLLDNPLLIKLLILDAVKHMTTVIAKQVSPVGSKRLIQNWAIPLTDHLQHENSNIIKQNSEILQSFLIRFLKEYIHSYLNQSYPPEEEHAPVILANKYLTAISQNFIEDLARRLAATRQNALSPAHKSMLSHVLRQVSDFLERDSSLPPDKIDIESQIIDILKKTEWGERICPSYYLRERVIAQFAHMIKGWIVQIFSTENILKIFFNMTKEEAAWTITIEPLQTYDDQEFVKNLHGIISRIVKALINICTNNKPTWSTQLLVYLKLQNIVDSIVQLILVIFNRKDKGPLFRLLNFCLYHFENNQWISLQKAPNVNSKTVEEALKRMIISDNSKLKDIVSRIMQLDTFIQEFVKYFSNSDTLNRLTSSVLSGISSSLNAKFK